MARCFIILLLLLAGNVKLKPGPVSLYTIGLGKETWLESCVYSLVPKVDSIRIWAVSANADVFALSETWLKKTVSDNEIAISSYNVFHVDRKSKGGGVVLYVKSAYHATLIKSMSFELLAIDVKLGNTSLAAARCYRPPSALSDTLSSLSSVLTKMIEIILLGDINWDWMKDDLRYFKAYCHFSNVTQVINAPTCPNTKNTNKSTLIDVILINKPDK